MLPSLHIRTEELLSRVDALAESASDQGEFFRELLELISTAVDAQNGNLWTQTDNGFEVMASIKVNDDWGQADQEVAFAVFQSNLPSIHYLKEDSNSVLKGALLLVPLNNDQQCFAVASLNVIGQSSPVAEANLGMLVVVSERIARKYERTSSIRLIKELSEIREAQTVCESVGKYLEIKPVAYTLVNRLQGYLRADRVSLTIYRGRKSRTAGISNQAVFDRRSNVVKQLEELASQIARMEEPFVHPSGDSSSVSPKLTKLAEKYFESSNSVQICLLPIFANPNRRDDPEDIARTIQTADEGKCCVGVLIVEGVERMLDMNLVLSHWRRIEPSISQSVNNARQHDGLFLMPVWRSLGSFADLYRGHTQRKATIITALFAIVLFSLALFQGEFKIRAEGVIQPIVRQHVYAEMDGTIDTLRSAESAQVKEGELLISLRNPELASRVADIAGKLREAEVQLQTVTMQRITRSFANEQEARDLVRTASTVEAKISGLRDQLTLLEKSKSQLEIRSPISGQLVTWDIEQRLRDRPVKPGQRLLTVADTSGGWEIELRVPDKRAGYLMQEWQNSQQSSRPMTASFVLTSDATKVYTGKVFALSPSSNVDDKESENVVRVRVRLADDVIAKIIGTKPGTSVIGQVHCGRASIGYCKLYEFFDWIHREWFRFIT